MLGARTAFSESMRAKSRANIWSAGLFALALLCLFTAAAEARTRRSRSRNAFVVAVQPFLFVRSVVHAVADPIVYNAPRVVTTLATAPRRAVYRDRSEVFEGEAVDESELEDEDGLAAEPADDEPMQVAYYPGRPRRPSPPRAERAHPVDAYDKEDGPRRAVASEDFESRGGPRPSVGGSRAILRNGVAHAPANAPQSVKNAIWAANSLRRKPYIWGGGHGSFYDQGYDCSGTVSFALRGAGALETPLPSSDLMRFGERGRGRWITVYARPGHTFAVIAGLRLDTTDFLNGGNTGPRWHEDGRDTSGYAARHPAGL